MTVRLHPESTPDPLTMRWVTDASTAGPLPELEALVDDGTLAGVEVGTGEIRTRLSPQRSWADDGARVRTAVFQALSRTADDSLEGRVAEVLRREVSPYVDSHGGRIEIASLNDGVLTVALGGACGHCTMRAATLRNLVANAVRRFPEIRDVRAAS